MRAGGERGRGGGGELSADLERKELLMDGRWELWSPVIGQGSAAGHRLLVKGDWSQAIGGTPWPIGVALAAPPCPSLSLKAETSRTQIACLQTHISECMQNGTHASYRPYACTRKFTTNDTHAQRCGKSVWVPLCKRVCVRACVCVRARVCMCVFVCW